MIITVFFFKNMFRASMSDFTSQTNAVKPIPNWPIKVVKDRTVTYSTTPPK